MNRMVFKSTFSLLNVDYVQLGVNWNYKNVTSTFYRIYLIDDGNGVLYDPGSSFTLEKGHLYMVPSFTTCNYYCGEYLSQYYISFIEEAPDGTSLFANNRRILKIPAIPADLEHFKRILELNPNRGLKRSDDPKVYEKYPVLQSFRELNNYMQLSAYVETQGLLLQMLSRFLTPDCFDAPESVIHSKISAAINYIQTNLHKPITVATLAQQANQNADYFSRLFREHTGERPLSYIQLKRVERAQFLLGNTDQPLAEIAAQTGFESLSYFTRIFKEKTGQTPGEYKNSHRLL
ncbi:AraC family transcriptional regulator [uncultured Chitinophaga sp.]|uniref:helix-turn-helix domain-containing protein n=1 Tax=uncultured Chitinophaga sp. TaxID=339340 RepID=UPI00262707B8|nr:AraC family transcriptional regulator [uncultured Chitinophaga sp.]